MSSNTLDITKNSEFFIALCQYGPHSYVALGAKTKDKTQLLASFGKIASERTSNLCTSLCTAVFNKVPATILNEPVTKHLKPNGFISNPSESNVTYKAYDISYQNYIEFLLYMKQLSVAQRAQNQYADILEAYIPITKTDKKVTFEWRSVESLNVENQIKKPHDKDTIIEPTRNSKALNLSLVSNTCRHSAIHFTQQARNNKHMGQGVSSAFFKKLPLKATFTNGEVSKQHYFYILPLPPSSYSDLSKEQEHILKKLYKRLDRLLQKHQNNPLTAEKFEQLKTLYNSITPKQTTAIWQVIDAVETWEKDNKTLISSHRSSFCFHFGKTATESMFKSFHNDFDRITKENTLQPV
jgi:hypothetical protein